MASETGSNPAPATTPTMKGSISVIVSGVVVTFCNMAELIKDKEQLLTEQP